MKRMFLAAALLTVVVLSCKKEKDSCETCVNWVGGVAGNDTLEVREVCDHNEVIELEESSSGTTVWNCE